MGHRSSRAMRDLGGGAVAFRILHPPVHMNVRRDRWAYPHTEHLRPLPLDMDVGQRIVAMRSLLHVGVLPGGDGGDVVERLGVLVVVATVVGDVPVAATIEVLGLE